MSTTSEATVMPHMPPERFLLLLRLLPILLLVLLLALVAEPEEAETKDKCQNCQYHSQTLSFLFIRFLISAAKIQNFPQTAKKNP